MEFLFLHLRRSVPGNKDSKSIGNALVDFSTFLEQSGFLRYLRANALYAICDICDVLLRGQILRLLLDVSREIRLDEKAKKNDKYGGRT